MRALLDVLTEEKRLIEEREAIRYALTTIIPYEERQFHIAGLDAVENQLKRVRIEIHEYFSQLNN